MSLIDVIIFGIIQGITEFLPISSSGHLEIVKSLTNNNAIPKESMMITVALHGATALSTIVVFKKEIIGTFQSLFDKKLTPNKVFSINIILSMIPAVIIGVCFNDLIESFFTGNILLVGFMLLITGITLLFTNYKKSKKKEVSYKSAIIIGISQAIAILPGISRSGVTISTALLLGIDKKKATKFSFIMVIPLVFGKMFKDFIDNDRIINDKLILPLIIGFIVAFITGIIACKWMIFIVNKSKLNYFVIYCFIIGISSIVYSFF